MDWPALVGNDDTITFQFMGPPINEECHEEGEEEIPSSPPCLPNYESSPLPEPLSTHCPYQHYIQITQSLRAMIIEGRTAVEPRLYISRENE
jgi:hypothetical protein